MMPTSRPNRPAILSFSRIVGYLMLALVSGCGLAMDSGGRLLLGRASVEVGDGPAAEKELRRAMKLGTPLSDVAAELSRALVSQGKFDEVLNEVSLEGPLSRETEATVRRVHGDAYLGLNQPETAREMFSSALLLQPENLSARLGIVSSFVAENNFAQARGGMEQILETYPDISRVWLYSGSFNARSGDFKSAEANFKVALDLASSQGDNAASLQALAGLAESLLEQREIDAARARVDQLAVDAPQSFQTMSLIARIAYIDEDWTTAQQNLQQILRTSPNYRPAQMLLGAVHLRSGNLSQAEMYLSAAVAAVPDDVRARQLLAETQLQMQKADEAQEALAPILSGPNADSMSLQMAARATIGRRDVDQALEYLRRNVDENPGNADLRFQLAATLLQMGRHDEAQAVLDAIDVSDSEENAFRRDALAAMDESAGEFASAASRYKGILADKPDAAWAMFALGRIAFRLEDYEGAAENFRRASAATPENADYRLNLARAERPLGNGGLAEQLLEDEIEASLEHLPSAIMLGTLKAESGDLAGAPDIARQLQKRYPDDPVSYAFEGEMHLVGDNLVRADSAYEKALSLGPVKNHALQSFRIKRQLGVTGPERPLIDFLASRPLDNEVRVVLAESYMQTNNLGKSIATYERVVSEEPANAVALNNLAWTYYLTDDPRAIATAQKARDAMPDNGAIVDTLSCIMIQQGSIEVGERLLREVVEMENGRAEIRYHHAVALAKLGDNDEARATLQPILGGDEKFTGRKDAEELLTEL